MKCNWANVYLGWRCGDIVGMSKEAVEIAKLLDTKVSFLFSGVMVNVSAKSDCYEVSCLVLKAVEHGLKSVYGEGF